MSETALDQIRHWRDRAAQGVVTRLTTVQIIRLCDAAERAETLQQLRERAESDADEAIRSQLAAVKRADAAEAQLTEVTRERDELRQVSETAISGWKARSAKAEAALKMEQNAHDVCSHGQQIIIDKLNQESQRAESAEAALAPLRAVVEAAKAFMLKWPDVEKASFAAVQIATIHGFPYTGPNVGAELKALADALAALPADPSAPTPR